MSKKVLFVLFAILMMAVMTVSVSAEQDGNDRWCNIDQYGCWVTGDDGAQNYIMFWTEEARQYFMGGNTAPYKNVQERCTDCSNGRLPLSKSWVSRGIILHTREELEEMCAAYGGHLVQTYCSNGICHYDCPRD